MKERRVPTETDPIRVAFDLDHGDGLAMGSELCRSRLEANRLRRRRLKCSHMQVPGADMSMLLEICAWDEKLAAFNSCRNGGGSFRIDALQRSSSSFRVSTRSPAVRRYRYTLDASSLPASSRPSHRRAYVPASRCPCANVATFWPVRL